MQIHHKMMNKTIKCSKCGAEMIPAKNILQQWFPWMDEDGIPVDWVYCPECSKEGEDDEEAED